MKLSTHDLAYCKGVPAAVMQGISAVAAVTQGMLALESLLSAALGEIEDLKFAAVRLSRNKWVEKVTLQQALDALNSCVSIVADDYIQCQQRIQESPAVRRKAEELRIQLAHHEAAITKLRAFLQAAEIKS